MIQSHLKLKTTVENEIFDQNVFDNNFNQLIG